MYDLLITAVVPLICRIDVAVLTCNSPRGYEVFARDPAGVSRLLERSDRPARKPVSYELRDGEYLIVVAR